MSTVQKLFLTWLALLLASLWMMAGTTPVEAGGSNAPEAVTVSPDPAFDRFVDLDLLGTAWADKNALLLTDVGLQLAEGERVLLRSHHSITAEQVLAMAAKIAAERKDARTLERIAKALETLKKSDLLAQVHATQKLIAASRAPSPALVVPANKMGPEVFLLFRDTLDCIIDAKVVGDSETLEIMIQLTPTMTRIPEPQRKYLLKTAADARAALPADAATLDPAAEALNKLFDNSRGKAPAILEATSLGVKYTASPKGLRVVGFSSGSPVSLSGGAKLSKGDLILRIGAQACYGISDLDGLVEQAQEAGNQELLLFESKSKRLKTYELPRP